MKRSERHSSLFLLELMIAILFFALVSATCLKVFAKAHIMSTEASNLNHGTSELENVAELLKSMDVDEVTDSEAVTNTLVNYYDKAVDVTQITTDGTKYSSSADISEVASADTDITEDSSSADAAKDASSENVTWYIYFDQDWNACPDYDGVYRIELEQADASIQEGICTYQLSVSEITKEEPIQKLTLELHTQ